VGIKKNYRKKIVYKKNMQKTLRRNARKNDRITPPLTTHAYGRGIPTPNACGKGSELAVRQPRVRNSWGEAQGLKVPRPLEGARAPTKRREVPPSRRIYRGDSHSKVRFWDPLAFFVSFFRRFV